MEIEAVSKVKEHLIAIDPDVEDWIVELAELVLIVLKCDPAMAASRARDLSRQKQYAIGLKDFISGWIQLNSLDGKGLTALQKSTLKRVVEAINKNTSSMF